MKVEKISFFEWQSRFQTEQDCLIYLQKLKWPNGFICPQCGQDHAHFIQVRQLYQCSACQHQTSLKAGTLFHRSHLPLRKWFWGIYFIGSDKGGISAMRLSKLIEVNWRTARLMLKKLRQAMAHRDSLYQLGGLIEVDDALVGGKRPGKRGRGAIGKTSVLVACESKESEAGYVAMKAVKSVNHKTVKDFVNKRISEGQKVHTDALAALNIIGEKHEHEARVTPSGKVDQWLPWVHITIGNLKAFLLGTFHGVSGKYLQEYLDEFCYRFNRRFFEVEIPNRLLNLAVIHAPIKSC